MNTLTRTSDLWWSSHDHQASGQFFDGIARGSEAPEQPRLLRTEPNAAILALAPGLVGASALPAAASTITTFTVTAGALNITAPTPVALWAGTMASNNVTTWTTLSDSNVTVAAGASQAVTLTIAVPATSSEGESYGVIWAQLASTGTPGQVSVVHRVAVRMYLSIGPGGDPASSMTLDARLSAGLWLATLDLHSGLLTTHAEGHRRPFPDESARLGPAVAASPCGGNRWVYFGAAGVAAALVVAGSLLVLTRRRRRAASSTPD